MQLSARNVFKGKVKAVADGVVNTEVTVEIEGGAEIVAVITKSSADRLNLAAGKDVYAVVKASSVMIAAD